MRTVSENFIEASLSPIGYATAYVMIGDTRIDASNLTDITINTELCESGSYSVGSFNTTEISITAVSDALPNVVTAQPITVYLGYFISSSGTYEYVPMGVFYAEPRDVSHKNLLTIIRAHDISWTMTDNYVSALTYPCTAQDVLGEIQTDLSITYGTFGGLAPSSVTVYEAPEGSYRDAIAQIALLMGTCAKVNRAGSLDFIKVMPSAPVQTYGAYDYTADNYELTSNEPMAYGVLTVNYVHEVVTGEGEDQRTDEVTDTYTYSAPTGSHGITIETRNIRSQAETNALGAELLENGFAYYGYSVTLPGQPQIDLGDSIRLTEPLGATYDFIVLSVIHNFNGAMKSTFVAAVNDAPTIEAGNIGGSLKEQMTTVSNALGRQTRLLADTIAANRAEFNDLQANKANVSDLTAINASIADLSANKADVADLTAINADITDLKANKANVSDLTAINADITNLKTNKADVSALNAESAKITALQTGKADIDFANVDVADITEAWIKDLLVQGNVIAQSGTVYNLTAVHVNGDLIDVNTLKADRLLLQGSNGLYYAINVDALGQTTASSDPKYQEGIDGKAIVAHSITADELTVNNITGTGGWINLAQGTFAYNNVSSGHGIAWDGTHLTISADSILLSGGDIGVAIQNAEDVANAIESTVNGMTYYQYTTGGTTYNVLYDEANDRYYYFDDNEQEVTVTYAQLDKDEDDVPITVTSGGIQSQVNDNTDALSELRDSTTTSIDSLSTQISNVETGLGSDISELGDQVTALSDTTTNSITALEERTSANATAIGNQGDRLATAEGEISNLHGIIVDKYEAFIDVQPTVPSITLGKRNDSAVRTRLEITDEVVNFYTDGKNSAKASGKSFESPEGKFEQITMKTVSGVGDLRWIARSNGHLSLKKITGDN